MSGLELALAAAALIVGLTGTWSPCGFSMIETIGPTGHTGGRRTTLAACATFLPGALAGGVATFGGLAALGGLLPGDGELAYLVAAAIAAGAAVLEARGARIVPQIRRQLPEHWRRVMPMPVAAGLYGGLLGLGFTTFVLTFGVWALAAAALAVGDPATGLVIGIAFGLGRALPIVTLAPLAASEAGARVTQLMADRPGLYRGLRLGDAAALALAAVVLASSSDAVAERTAVWKGADPSFANGLAYQKAKRVGFLRDGGQTRKLDGKDPAIGGPYVAVRAGGGIRVLNRDTLERLADLQAGKVNALAIARNWVAWRARLDGRDQIRARRIKDLQSPNEVRRIQRANKGQHLGMPGIDGASVVYSVSSKKRNLIVRRSLERRRGRTLASSRGAWLHSPSLGSRRLLFVKVTDDRQQLVLKRLGKGGRRVLFSRPRGAGTLWSTALGAERAYVTLIRGGPDRILSAGR
jgi:hypothetical protein